jgi:hypothetical protein
MARGGLIMTLMTCVKDGGGTNLFTQAFQHPIT